MDGCNNMYINDAHYENQQQQNYWYRIPSTLNHPVKVKIIISICVKTILLCRGMKVVFKNHSEKIMEMPQPTLIRSTLNSDRPTMGLLEIRIGPSIKSSSGWLTKSTITTSTKSGSVN